MNRYIMHVDVNSAYLSWEAAYRLQRGECLDLRDVPSVVGGDEKKRHGIVLAKSIPAKKFNIKTGESLFSVKEKCPEIIIVPPNYNLYVNCSNAFVEILLSYTPLVQRYSVDECFCDFTSIVKSKEEALDLAYKIKEKIKRELGFTVNIGISSNKLLAKMASDLEKPDKVHTLYQEEIKEKMWPLKVEELFMVGRATLPKLNRLNIYTIGDLANYDINILKDKLKSFGVTIWNYANGIEDSSVSGERKINAKGVGNSTTVPFDVEDRETAERVLISLCETVAMRLRALENLCWVISVSYKDGEFYGYSKQRKLYTPTDSTKKIMKVSLELFNELWKEERIRAFGVHLSELCSNDFIQESFIDSGLMERERHLDRTVDEIRRKYGKNSVVRSTFLYSGINPMTGGVGEVDFPMMSSLL